MVQKLFQFNILLRLKIVSSILFLSAGAVFPDEISQETEIINPRYQQEESPIAMPVLGVHASNFALGSIELGLLFPLQYQAHRYGRNGTGIYLSVEPGIAAGRAGLGLGFLGEGELLGTAMAFEASYIRVWGESSGFLVNRHYLGGEGRFGFLSTVLRAGAYLETETLDPYFSVSIGMFIL